MAEAPDPDENPFDNFNRRPHLDSDISIDVDEDEIGSEELEVAKDTEKVFKSFVFTRLTSHIDKETAGDLNIADISTNDVKNIRDEKKSFEKEEEEEDPNNRVIELGRTLADLGDEIQNKYHADFSIMLSKLNLQHQELAFETFQKIARRLFDNGINWGRIVSLFCFGYEIAVSLIRQGTAGIRSFLNKILKYIVGFFYKEKIAKWIADQGGWIMFKFQEYSSDVWLQRVSMVVAACAICYGIYKITKKS